MTKSIRWAAGSTCIRSTCIALASLAAIVPNVSAQGVGILPPPQYVASEVSDKQLDAAIIGLDELAKSIFERSGVPGLAVAVVRDGETVYARGFGLRRSDAMDRIDADTVFLLASLSKPLGATVVASQVGRGLLEWDTPLVTLLPWFELSDPWVTANVTIGDLYAHRSGLPGHAGDDLEDLGYDRQEVLERLSLLPLSPFRSTYAYTNFGLTAAAEGVARAADTDWETLSRDTLYAPLGMDATSSTNARFLAQPNRSSSHIPQDGEYVVADLRQPDAQSAAGGVSSSVNDMAKWMSLVLQGGEFRGEAVIPREALLPAVTAQVISAPSFAADARAGTYGFGYNVGIQPSGRVAISHSGAFALGAGTSVSMIPSLGIGIVVLTNASPTGAAEAITAGFLDHVQFGAETRDWFATFQPIMASLMLPEGALAGAERPVTPKPHRGFDAYLGNYQNEYFGNLEIIEHEDGVALLIGPAGKVEPLTHWDGDDFTYEPFNENAPMGSVSRVSFGNFGEQRAHDIVVEHLDAVGFGTFVR